VWVGVGADLASARASSEWQWPVEGRADTVREGPMGMRDSPRPAPSVYDPCSAVSGGGVSDLEDSLVFQCRAARLPTPVRQHRFHAERRWRFDLAWVDRKLAVEVDGGTFVYGGHNRGAQIARDMEKQNAAVMLGWRVLRFDTHMVGDGRAVDVIEEALGQ
jgi:very-short-patch-repair endonuclease